MDPAQCQCSAQLAKAYCRYLPSFNFTLFISNPRLPEKYHFSVRRYFPCELAHVARETLTKAKVQMYRQPTPSMIKMPAPLAASQMPSFPMGTIGARPQNYPTGPLLSARPTYLPGGSTPMTKPMGSSLLEEGLGGWHVWTGLFPYSMMMTTLRR